MADTLRFTPHSLRREQWLQSLLEGDEVRAVVATDNEVRDLKRHRELDARRSRVIEARAAYYSLPANASKEVVESAFKEVLTAAGRLMQLYTSDPAELREAVKGCAVALMEAPCAAVLVTQPPVARVFWLSFADPTLPKGSQFLGVCVVEAMDSAAAVKASHIYGCNPGGEVVVYEVERDDIAGKGKLNHLYRTRGEIEAVFGGTTQGGG